LLLWVINKSQIEKKAISIPLLEMPAHRLVGGCVVLGVYWYHRDARRYYSSSDDVWTSL